MTRCDHCGIGRYSRRFKAIRFVVVCDSCGEECREVQVDAYEPRFVADAPENLVADAPVNRSDAA